MFGNSGGSTSKSGGGIGIMAAFVTDEGFHRPRTAGAFNRVWRLANHVWNLNLGATKTIDLLNNTGVILCERNLEALLQG